MQSNHHERWNDAETGGDVLDRALDAALAKYSSVEPRLGLEQRILARLRSEQDRIPTRSWWQWSAVGAVTALIVIAIGFAWKSNWPAKTVSQRHPSAPIEMAQPSATQVAANGETQAAAVIRRRYKATRRRVPRPVAVADEPKLDQFPSPEPLTQEELALVRYVRQFPSDAVMVASAQEEFEKEIQQEGAAGRQDTSNSIKEER